MVSAPGLAQSERRAAPWRQNRVTVVRESLVHLRIATEIHGAKRVVAPPCGLSGSASGSSTRHDGCGTLDADARSAAISSASRLLYGDGCKHCPLLPACAASFHLLGCDCCDWIEFPK